jgi:NAD(P)-dependent dehydrogenase (short-subunit alcohol dehydrogenase family)
MNILITGANQGLGLSLVKVFTRHGHQVVAGLYPGDSASPLTNFAADNPGQVTIIPMDVTDEDSIQTAALKIRDRFGKLDLVVSNAGVLALGDRTLTIAEMDIGDLRHSLEVNTIGTVIVMKHFLPLMPDDAQGMMLFITSEAGSVSNTGTFFPAYSISKTAANKAVFILRATAGKQCKIYALHPGRMNTEMGQTTAQIEPEEAAEGIYRIATGITVVDETETGFIDYRGERMPL